MTTTTEFIVPHEYIDLIIEIQDMAGWATQTPSSYKILCKIYEMTTEFLRERGLLDEE